MTPMNNSILDIVVALAVHGVVSVLVVVGWALLLTPVWVLFSALRVIIHAQHNGR